MHSWSCSSELKFFDYVTVNVQVMSRHQDAFETLGRLQLDYYWLTLILSWLFNLQIFLIVDRHQILSRKKPTKQTVMDNEIKLKSYCNRKYDMTIACIAGFRRIILALDKCKISCLFIKYTSLARSYAYLYFFINSFSSYLAMSITHCCVIVGL